MTQNQHSEPTYWRDDPTTGEIEPHPDGDWVRREDYDELGIRLKGMEAEVELRREATDYYKGIEEQLEAAQKVIDAATEYVFSSDGNAFGKFHDTLAEYATSNPASRSDDE